MDDLFVNVSEVRQLLGVSRSMTYKLLNDGRLPCYKDDRGHIRIPTKIIGLMVEGEVPLIFGRKGRKPKERNRRRRASGEKAV